jgi:four helix bundle protein
LEYFQGFLCRNLNRKLGGRIVRQVMFTHHKLQVYEKALALSACADELSSAWNKRHAIVDHFRRASESVVLNIVEGARLRSGPAKVRALEYAVGSTLECAACLDIAAIKGELSNQRLVLEKGRILEITRMLIGLRKAWLPSVLREEPTQHQWNVGSPAAASPLFHHESLDVYRVGLDFIRWFVGVPGGRELTERLCREIDNSGTSVVLNVAEGNGRYSELDHHRFLEIAGASVVKAAAYLDLYRQKLRPTTFETSQGRELLGRISAMIESF